MLSLAVPLALLFSDQKRLIVLLNEESLDVGLSLIVSCHTYSKSSTNQRKALTASIHQVYVV